jgi:tetratricopeptide (TPR) repeat protein
MKTVGVRGAIDSAGYSAPAAIKVHSELTGLLVDVELEALKNIFAVGLHTCGTNGIQVPSKFSLAFTDLQVNKLEQARQILESSLQERNSYDARALLAFVEQLSGNLETAAEEFQRASNMSSSARANFAWGASLLLLGNSDSAMEAFDQGLTKREDGSLAVIGRGVALADRGRTTEALQLFLSAAQQKPFSFYPYAFIARIVRSPGCVEQPGTDDVLRRLIGLAPDNAEAYFAYACSSRNRAKTAQDNGTPDAVQVSLTRALALNPHSAEAHNVLGTVLFEKHEYKLAATEYQEALKENPDLTELHYRLAQTYIHMGEKDLAETQLAAHKITLASQSDPGSPPAMYSRFTTFLQKADPAKLCEAPLP